MAQERTLANGARAKFVVGPNGNPVFRIVSGASTAALARARSARGKAPRPLSLRAAKAAFTRHYNSLPHSEKGKQIAMGRERCNATRPVVRDTRYSHKGGPGRFNYPGVDDGANCKGTVRRVSRKASAAQAAALARGRQRRARNLRANKRSQSGGARKSTRRSNRRSNRRSGNRR